ncbi:hypothetical protein TIFTF001_020160 [Ficus carica]|uniref:Uncharacterized protein n=1 Tax=Ficus carica TaxID=3494 RepID=A0AA88AA82_FICCA|nr:hypothetical protein TIFTF001_020160 [Ficus carica]
MEVRRQLHLCLFRRGHLRRSSGNVSFVAHAVGSGVVAGADDAPLPHLLARPHEASPQRRALPVHEQPRHRARVVAIVSGMATHHSRQISF